MFRDLMLSRKGEVIKKPVAMAIVNAPDIKKNWLIPNKYEFISMLWQISGKWLILQLCFIIIE